MYENWSVRTTAYIHNTCYVCCGPDFILHALLVGRRCCAVPDIRRVAGNVEHGSCVEILVASDNRW